ncbi:MAG: T9SS type A sorting domain-containing protein [Sphingobacteriales bacterium]|nr:T9SS type A sorting domain-containing protein [Sphingobacteriales bacterium]
MRKILSLFVLVVLGMNVFAQNSIVSQKLNGEIPKDPKLIQATEWPAFQAPYREDIKSEWYSFTSALDFFLGGTMRYFTNAIFPDTFVQRVNNDGTTSYVKWHSMGLAFDPRDDMWPLSDYDQLEKKQPYRVDSIAFRYLYEKFNSDAVKDKLVIQFYNADKVDRYNWTSTQEPWATVEYDTTTLSGVDFTQQIIYELEYKDTATWESGQYKWLSFPVNIDVPKTTHPIFVTTFTFKPAYSYKFNDTLINFDTNQKNKPYKKLNAFYHQMFYDPDGTQLTSYNNGLVMNYQMRYGKFLGDNFGWRYLPGNAFSVSYYPYIIYKITYDNDWVDAINEGNVSFKVGEIYPNPARQNAKLAVNLMNAGNVSIEFVNALGQSVKVMDNEKVQAGEHVYTLNTSDLVPGMYIVKVTVDGYSSTQNLLVK